MDPVVSTCPSRWRAYALGVALVLLTWSSGSGMAAEAAEEEHRGTRFVAIGHLYPIEEDRELLDALFRAVNAEKPDLVFLLGDCSVEKPEMHAYYEAAIDAPVHYAPGNHEVHDPEHRAAYVRHVGALDSWVATDDAGFVLLNSSQEAAGIRSFLDRTLPQLDEDLPVIVLTHHRIWDDTRLSPRAYGHQKGYLFSEIYPSLEGRADYVFAGNSKLHYFREVKNRSSYGKQNVHNVLWSDMVGELVCYSIGMGEGRPKAGYAVADVVGSRLLVEPRYVTLQETDPTHAAMTRVDDLICWPQRWLENDRRQHSFIGFAVGVGLSAVLIGLAYATWRFGGTFPGLAQRFNRRVSRHTRQ